MGSTPMYSDFFRASLISRRDRQCEQSFLWVWQRGCEAVWRTGRRRFEILPTGRRFFFNGVENERYSALAFRPKLSHARKHFRQPRRLFPGRLCH